MKRFPNLGHNNCPGLGSRRRALFLALTGTIADFSRCSGPLAPVTATVMDMPLCRYFTLIGSVLLALLFLTNWCLPQQAATPAWTDVDRTVIRLHSSHEWPERIVIDTSLPTIVPPSAKVATLAVTSPPAARPPSEAFALATPARTVAPTIALKSTPKRRTRTVRVGGRATSFDGKTEFRTAFPMIW
jgi:hypothetical protein